MNKITGTQLKDAYKKIRSNLDLNRQPAVSIAVLSACPDEGRSSVAWNLACSYADKGDRVLLINADMHSKGAEILAGKAPSKGLREAVRDFDPMKPVFSADLLEEVRTPSGSSLYLMGAGDTDPGCDVIHSRAFSKLLKEASRELDKIIIDSPAASVSADAYAIGSLADEAIFVYSGKSTGKYEAREAMDDFERNNARIQGVVMTRIGKLQS